MARSEPSETPRKRPIMSSKTLLLCPFILLLGGLHAGAVGAQEGTPPAEPAAETVMREGIPWTARTVEHLFNRAAFGVTPDKAERALQQGPGFWADVLLNRGREVEPFFLQSPRVLDRKALSTLTEEERRALRSLSRRDNNTRMRDYRAWWLDAMIDEKDPLRERMTLFWHGFFPSAFRKVKRADTLIRQHQFLRENALGNYGNLLRGIVKDAAMLDYLDNNLNRKDRINENLGRELLELFSLGEGNYTEEDVLAASRALTGMAGNKDGEYVFRGKLHDNGEKTFLGRTGHFRGEDLVSIILAQEACPRWVAKNIITHFEGVEPSPERLETYAQLLRKSNYELKPLLRALFLDPEFYRDEVVGTRVQGPVEYLVGSCKRLGVRPPSTYIARASASLGQDLFNPPSVNGWAEGEAWITTATMLQRGNVAGLMLGAFDLDSSFIADPISRQLIERTSRFIESKGGGRRGAPQRGREREASTPPMDGEDGESMGGGMAGQEAMAQPEPVQGGVSQDVTLLLEGLRRAFGRQWAPTLNLTWRLRRLEANGDAAVVDALLQQLIAVEPPADVRQRMIAYLAQERAALGIEEQDLLEYSNDGEELLRRLAHLMMSLPIAQLN